MVSSAMLISDAPKDDGTLLMSGKSNAASGAGSQTCLLHLLPLHQPVVVSYQDMCLDRCYPFADSYCAGGRASVTVLHSIRPSASGLYQLLHKHMLHTASICKYAACVERETDIKPEADGPHAIPCKLTQL